MSTTLTLGGLRLAAESFKREGDDVLTVYVGDDALDDMRRLPNFVSAPYRTMAAKPDELGCVEIFRFYPTSESGWAITGKEPA